MRTRPTNKMLKATRKANAEDYAQLAAVAADEVLRTRVGNFTNSGRCGTILASFPYFVKFTPGFPKGVHVRREGLFDIRKINVVRLLDWLYRNGHSAYNGEMLLKRTWHFDRLEDKVEGMFEIFDDIPLDK